MNDGKLALVAGEGELPLEILKAMKNSGTALPKVYLFADDERPYSEQGIAVQRITNPMAIAMTLAKMRLSGIKQMIMAGRIPKRSMYNKKLLDEGAKTILSSVQERSDHNLLAGVVKYIEKFGIKVVGYDDIIPEMLAQEGKIAGPDPSEEQLRDCEYGIKILKVLLPLSFGQSLVVSGRAVVAVEAMEGTDQIIKRAGALSGHGILLKGMRADQDRRYDIPVVGIQTLHSMYEAGLKGLFIESGNVLLLHKSEFIQEADRLGICVTGVPSCQFS
jgi:DUF1009 family protein